MSYGPAPHRRLSPEALAPPAAPANPNPVPMHARRASWLRALHESHWPTSQLKLHQGCSGELGCSPPLPTQRLTLWSRHRAHPRAQNARIAPSAALVAIAQPPPLPLAAAHQRQPPEPPAGVSPWTLSRPPSPAFVLPPSILRTPTASLHLGRAFLVSLRLLSFYDPLRTRSPRMRRPNARITVARHICLRLCCSYACTSCTRLCAAHLASSSLSA